MPTNLHLIYVPGLGDANPTLQTKAVRSWRLWGVTSELCHMKWATSEPWEAKLGRLLNRIDTLVADGQSVALVGASAGAAAVINAYALRKDHIVGCVLIAGKVNDPTNIANHYRQENPAFVDAIQQCQEALQMLTQNDRKRIMSCYARYDGIVPTKDSYIEGAHNQGIHSTGHAFTIAMQITIGAPRIISFLKSIK